MNRVSLSLGLVIGVALAGLVSACTTSVSPSAPSALSVQASGGASIASRNAGKVDVCHGNGQGAYSLLSIASAAEAAHLGHGDGRVGDPFPGQSGFVFGPSCEAVSGGGGGSSSSCGGASSC